MQNYDDLFNNNIPEPTDTPPEFSRGDFDPEAWAANKKQERDDVYALIDKTALELGVNSDAFIEYLDIQSRFNLYSVGNLLLIQAQMPTATKLKDFDGWKAAGTTVRKNQQSISILEPGKQYKRGDGSIGTSMNVKKVFNISQTYAKPEPKKTPVEIDRNMIKALMNLSTVKIIAVDQLPHNKKSVYDLQNNQIVIRKGMDAPDLFRELSETVAFVKFCSDRTGTENPAFKAQSVSYVLCRQYGVDSFKDFKTGDFTFDSIPDAFLDIDTGEPLTAQEIREDLTEIHKMANNFSESIRESMEQSKPDQSRNVSEPPEQGDR